MGLSRTSRLGGSGDELMKMGEKLIGRVVSDHIAVRYVLVNFPFAALPAFGPEPCLIRRHRQRRTQLQHAVITLEDFNLSARRLAQLAASDPHAQGGTRRQTRPA